MLERRPAPALAHLLDEEERTPGDRPIDGIDQSAFLLGVQEKSNCEHVLVYIGDDLFAVKWRTFKIHLKTAESMWAPVQTNIFPTVYDVRNDPGEDNELMKQSLFAYSWVYGAMGQVLKQKVASMQEYPNIQPGQDFEGY